MRRGIGVSTQVRGAIASGRGEGDIPWPTFEVLQSSDVSNKKELGDYRQPYLSLPHRDKLTWLIRGFCWGITAV